MRKARLRSMLCDTVYRFRANEQLVIPEYLELVLNTPRVITIIDSKKSGISDSGISLNHGRIKSVELLIPKGRSHQADIVRNAEEKLSKVVRLEEEIDQQIKRSELLKHAVLRRAFSGRLVAPNLADEPASVLLQRIKAEKQAANKMITRKDAA